MSSMAAEGGRIAATLATVSVGWLVCTLSLAGSVTGTATYRERIAVPADAVFEVELQDVARADAPAAVLGRARFDPAGQPPFRFEIPYEEAAVKSSGRYVVRATVRQGDRLLFTTDRAYPVLDGRDVSLDMLLVSARGGAQAGHATANVGRLPASYEGDLPGAGGPVGWHVDLLPDGRFQLRTTYVGKPEPNSFDDIGRWVLEGSEGRIALRGTRASSVLLLPVDGGAALRKLDMAGKPIDSSHHDSLARLPQFAPIEPRLRLTGMFSYMADAASITLCADGERLPVVMDADYKALVAAYRNAGLEPGQPLLAEIEGRVAQRPSMEERQPPRASLVVERFIAVWPRETCGNALADSSLRGTYWKLVRLGTESVIAPARQREPHLIFATDGMRVTGSGGCNRLAGGFELDGDQIRLDRTAATMMACPEGAEQEQRFLQALEQVRRYRIRGSHLELLDAGGTAIARFEAVALK